MGSWIWYEEQDAMKECSKVGISLRESSRGQMCQPGLCQLWDTEDRKKMLMLSFECTSDIEEDFWSIDNNQREVQQRTEKVLYNSVYQNFEKHNCSSNRLPWPT